MATGLDVVDVLAGLVRIPSVNPMGQPVGPDDIYYEHRMTEHLADLFTRLGLPFERHPVAPLRDNLLVRVEGNPAPDKGGKILLLEAHQDTVPVTGMTIPPFEPEVRDGRLYGRGSCDIKGGMAAMLVALARLAKLPKRNKRPTVVLACTINEEHGFTGATHLARMFSRVEGHPQSQLLPRVPDAAIVAEPTLLDVVTAHKGTVRWRCHTRGKAGHSSQPHLGDNAIYHMGRVLQALDNYADNVVPHLDEHPLVGVPTLSVGMIYGGLSVNTIPDKCTIEIDRRILPGEDPEAAWKAAHAYINSVVPPETPTLHEAPFMQSPGLSDEANGDLADKLAAAAAANGGGGNKIGVPYGTDAPAYAAAGCPTVVFGPGSIAQAHTVDEWVAVEQLAAAAEIYFEFAKSWV
jgi:acetylornithine deacetylase